MSRFFLGFFIFFSSNTGVVNIYDKDTCMASQSPRPEKAVTNLTSACTAAVFNSCTEILALASNLNEKAVKLVRAAGQLNILCCVALSVVFSGSEGLQFLVSR